MRNDRSQARFTATKDAFCKTQNGKIHPRLIFPCIPVSRPPFQDYRLSQLLSDSPTPPPGRGGPQFFLLFDRRRFCGQDIFYVIFTPSSFDLSQTSALHTSSPHDHPLMLFVINEAKVRSPNLSKFSGCLVVTSLRLKVPDTPSSVAHNHLPSPPGLPS